MFGTAAVKETAGTDFTIIQGGKNDNDDDDDNDKDSNIIHFPNIADAAKKYFAMTMIGAGAVSATIQAEYEKWVNGDADNLLDPFYEIYPSVTDSDIVKQWSGKNYAMSGFQVHKNWIYYYKSYNIYAFPVAATFLDGTLSYFSLNPSSVSQPMVLGSVGADYIYSDGSGKTGFVPKVNSGMVLSFSVNVPVFSSYEELSDYFISRTYENALNYAKTYRIADWLQENWAGELIDPLTGLNALSDWYNIARHQELNALGNDPSVDALLGYLRDYFAHLGTDVLPEVDPSLAPIAYPATMPDVSVDPGRNPSVIPDPGTKPEPGTDPEPDTDINIDPGIYQTDLRGLFPFCIPFDFIALLNALDADPAAPCFTVPVVIPALDYREDIRLDLSAFNDVAKVFRLCEKVSFLIFLMFITSKVIRW